MLVLDCYYCFMKYSFSWNLIPQRPNQCFSPLEQFCLAWSSLKYVQGILEINDLPLDLSWSTTSI